jgi:hypothetical protein
LRYRIGEDPATASGYAGTESVLIFTLFLSIIIGVILLWMGLRSRQLWLWTWSAGLIVVSSITLFWMWK